MQQRAEHRQAQPQPVQRERAAPGARGRRERGGCGGDDGGARDPRRRALQRVPGREQRARRRRQIHVEGTEHLREHRHDARHQEQHERERGGDDDRGIGQRGADLLAQVRIALEQRREPLEHVVEDAAGLAGADHGDVQRRERARAAPQRRAERRPVLHVREHRTQRFAQRAVGRPLDRHVERVPHRHAGADQRRE